MIKISTDPITLEKEDKTRFLLLKQGDNTLRFTVEDINAIIKMSFNEIETYGCVSFPKKTLRRYANGNIFVNCMEDNVSMLLVADTIKEIVEWKVKNAGHIARDRDFKK
jgi:hypothetical protein